MAQVSHGEVSAGGNIALNLLQEILEQLPQGVTVFDSALRLQCWNSKVADLLCLPPEQLFFGAEFDAIIRRLAERGDFGPGDIDSLVRDQRAATMQFNSLAFEREQFNGTVLYVQRTPLRESGRITGVISTYADVTEHRKSELELRRHHETLQTIVDNLPCGLTLLDDKLIVVAHNAEANRVLDFPESLMAGNATPLEAVIRFNARRGEYGAGDPEKITAAVMERARNQQAHVFERMRPNGMALEIRGTPLPHGGFVTMYTDITQHKHSEAVLTQAKETAEAANRAKSQFLSVISHELRTPMNGILGMAQLLAMKDLSEGERIEYANSIIKSGQTLLGMFNDLLDLSKVEAGKFELACAAFDVRRVLEETVATFAEQARQKYLHIEGTCSTPPDCFYLGDSQRVSQMLANLVSNAIKFTAIGHVRIDVAEIDRSEREATLQFSVTDTGVGISEEQQAHLFQSFSQVDATHTRSFGGAGLGLSIVRRLAELMGGQVGVRSRSGQGSHFWFRVRCGVVGIDDEAGRQQCELDFFGAAGGDDSAGTTGVASTVDPVPPAVAGPVQNLPGFDVPAALARLGGDIARYNSFLKLFSESIAEGISGIRSAMKRGDTDVAKLLAHSLAGSATTIGAIDLLAALSGLETGLAAGRLDPALLAAVEDEWQQASEYLDILLA